jgi:hypothetical protein
MQQKLIRAHDSRLVGAGERFSLRVRARWEEGVVVQQEECRDGDRPLIGLPDQVRVLRGGHAEVPAQLHQILVALFAA